MDYSKYTLGELLSSKNKTIRRNAISILKEFQRTIGAIVEPQKRFECFHPKPCLNCPKPKGECYECGKVKNLEPFETGYDETRWICEECYP